MLNDDGSIKDEYKNDPELSDYAQWAQKQYHLDSARAAVNELENPNTTPERRNEILKKMFNINEGKDPGIKLSLKKPINTELIIEHWDTIQRIVISLQEKSTTQAILVRKLSGYNQNHPLLQALTEYDRMIKAMYLLDYIDDASLRGYVQRALNRGEAYHQLRRAIASVNGNRFRGSSDYEISLWNECARLLANAIIYFNSTILTHLLTYFKSIDDEERLEITKQVSPVAWHNINLNGI